MLFKEGSYSSPSDDSSMLTTGNEPLSSTPLSSLVHDMDKLDIHYPGSNFYPDQFVKRLDEAIESVVESHTSEHC